MKKIMLFLLLIYTISVFSQDKITTLENQILNVTIIEKTDKQIKYTLSDSQVNTIFTTRLSKLRKIEYASGEVDLLGYNSIFMQRRIGINGGVSLNLNDGGMFTGSVDYFLFPKINLELNIGFGGETSYYSFGPRYFLKKKNSPTHFSPFVGLLYGNEGGYSFVELPVGLSYMSRCGFQSSVQLSGVNYLHYNYQGLLAEMRVGWRW